MVIEMSISFLALSLVVCFVPAGCAVVVLFLTYRFLASEDPAKSASVAWVSHAVGLAAIFANLLWLVGALEDVWEEFEVGVAAASQLLVVSSYFVAGYWWLLVPPVVVGWVAEGVVLGDLLASPAWRPVTRIFVVLVSLVLAAALLASALAAALPLATLLASMLR